MNLMTFFLFFFMNSKNVMRMNLTDSVMSTLQTMSSVKEHFGAKGDGSNDDTDAFNRALSESSRVFVPEGTYKITSSLMIRHGVRITGAGSQTKIVKHKPPQNNDSYHMVVLETDNANGAFDNIIIEHITFDGNKSESVGGEVIHINNTASNGRHVRVHHCAFYNFGPQGHAIHIKGYNHLFIHDNFIENGGESPYYHGIYLKRSSFAHMLHNKIVNVYGGGIKVDQGSTFIVDGNMIESAEETNALESWRGIYFDRADNIIIQNNIVSKSTNKVIRISTSSGIGKVTIVNNILHDIREEGIYVYNVPQLTISSNHFSGHSPFNKAIVVKDVPKFIITDNTFEIMHGDDSSTNARFIIVEDNSTLGIIKNNIFTYEGGASAYVITLQNATFEDGNNAIISDNLLQNCTLYAT